MTQLDNGSLSITKYRRDGGWEDPAHTERLLTLGYELPGVKQDAHAKFLGFIRRGLIKMGNDPNDLNAMMAGSDELDTRSTPSDPSISGAVVRQMFYVLSAPGQAIVKNEAVRRLTRCGLELYETRARTGKFPAALNRKDRWAIDPWTDQLSVYMPGKTGFILYSVGANKVDEGGRGRRGAPPTPDDIRFRTPRP